MFLTEQEILDTTRALTLTCAYFEKTQDEVTSFFEKNRQRKFVFFGCGSSFMLAKSAAAMFGSIQNTTAVAIPAGDYLVDSQAWHNTVKDSIVVALSRSGRTSEMVWAVKHLKQQLHCPVISISMEQDNDIMPMSDLDLTMDWCYDKSVCQTRTVTNLYAATLLLAATYAKDATLKNAVKAAAEANGVFQAENRSVLEQLAKMKWDNVVVLADGVVCGIAEEGALAFTEICMLTGRYFHLLDYRHGPIVVSGSRTMTLVLLRPGEEKYQGAMIQDVLAKGGAVLTASEQPGNPFGATAHVQIKGIDNFAAWGIPFIYLAQMLALLKAVEQGGNPDAPTGLDAYITL